MMVDQSSYKELEKEVELLEQQLAEQVSKEETLRAGQALYKKMFDHAGMAITVADAKDGRLVDCNRQAYESLGYTKTEYMNLSHEAYLLDSLENKIRIMKELREKAALVYTSRLKKKNGETMEVIGSAVRIKQGGRTINHLIRMDITEQKKTGQMLKESEERYRNIIDTMNEGYYERDLKGNLIFCNRGAEKIFGYTYEEIVGKNYTFQVLPETADKVFKQFNKVLRTGESDKCIEFDIIRKDGSKANLEVSVSLLKNEAGDNTGFYGLTRDVTQRKNLNHALKEKEELYRTLFEHAGFAMTLTDLKTGKIEACNKMAYENIGYTEEELIGKQSNLLYAGDEKTLADMLKSISETGAWEGSTRLKTKTGEVRDIYLSTVALTIDGKRYTHSIGVDITEEKRMEHILKESESQFRSVFETAADAIFLCDVCDRRILDANPAACNYLGYSREALLSRSMKDLTVPEYIVDTQTILESTRTTGSFIYESVHIAKNGAFVSVEVSTRIVEHQGREVLLSIARDVTERKKVEKQLAEQRTRLETLVQERTHKLEAAQKELIKQEKLTTLGQLTATVSHELRNPLGVIQSSNYYLKKKISNPDEKILKHLNRVDEQVSVCDAIVGDLLEYTRGPHAEMVNTEITPWMSRLVEQVCETEDIEVNCVLPENLPRIFHDKLKIQRVVINILDNAVQAVYARKSQCDAAGRPYQPEISLMVSHDASDLRMEIRDNGIGMDRQTQIQAFEPLFTTRPHGTGLGLAIVDKIIKEHHGDIALSSTHGQGTSVVITLPMKPQ